MQMQFQQFLNDLYDNFNNCVLHFFFTDLKHQKYKLFFLHTTFLCTFKLTSSFVVEELLIIYIQKLFQKFLNDYSDMFNNQFFHSFTDVKHQKYKFSFLPRTFLFTFKLTSSFVVGELCRSRRGTWIKAIHFAMFKATVIREINWADVHC